MKYYTTYAEIYHNGQLIETQYAGHCLTEEEKPQEETFIFTWDNLNEMYCKLNLICNFNIWKFKKGRRVSFFNMNLFNRNTWDIKEWKDELNIEIKVYHNEREATLENLKHFEATKVQKYLEKKY